MSSSFGPKIYLRGAILHTPIYGGIGHRPLLSEELVLFGVFMDISYYLVLLCEFTHIWPLFVIFANVSDHVSSAQFRNLT